VAVDHKGLLNIDDYGKSEIVPLIAYMANAESE
jgi:hypothetical protein